MSLNLRNPSALLYTCYDLIKSEGKPVTKETDRLGKMIKDGDETNGGGGIEDK